MNNLEKINNEKELLGDDYDINEILKYFEDLTKKFSLMIEEENKKIGEINEQIKQLHKK